MSTEFYRDLAWLPPAPSDFRERVKAVAQAPDWGRECRALAGYALGESELGRLANAIKERRLSGASGSLIPYRLGVVGNGTLEILAPSLVGAFARYGFAL